MVITKHTKYMLEHGEILEVAISSPRNGNREREALKKTNAYYCDERHKFFVKMTQEDYKEKCKILWGFNADYIMSIPQNRKSGRVGMAYKKH